MSVEASERGSVKAWEGHTLQTLREVSCCGRTREAFGVRGIPTLWLRLFT